MDADLIKNATLRAVLTKLCPRMLPTSVFVLIRDHSEVHVVLPSCVSTELRSLSSADFPNLIAYNPENGWYYAVDVFALRGRLDSTRTSCLAKAFGSSGKRVVLLNAFECREDFDMRIPVPWFTSAWIAEEPNCLFHFGGAFDWRGTPLWRQPNLHMVSHPIADKFGTPHMQLGFLGEKHGMIMSAEIAYQVLI